MPESQRPLKVFLCHAHADRDPVRGLYVRLTQDGVDAWLDKAKLLPGQDWEMKIRKAVREADVVVVCLSKQFNEDGFRQKEVKLALDVAMEKREDAIFIIPARLEECDNLESLRKWHWVDLFEEDGYEMLMRALRARADRIGAVLQLKGDVSKSIIGSGDNNVANLVGKGTESTSPKNGTRPKKTKTPNKINPISVAALIVLAGTLITVLFISLLIIKFVNTEIGLKFTSTPVVSTFTPEVDVTSLTPLPFEFVDKQGVPMRLVPEGSFVMGGDADESYNACENYGDTVCTHEMFMVMEPQHTVQLSNYYIDKYEVTNALYRSCVNAGACIPPLDTSSRTEVNYFDNPRFDNYPVIHIEWDMAKTYCDWRGGRLPTEAEWEKAARGMNSRIYPWGEEMVACNKANYFGCVGDTVAVGSYESGKSVYGVYDMAGNVWEWVSSIGMAYPYNADDGREDLNATGLRILRGGSWSTFGYYLRSPMRGWYFKDFTNSYGFRCAVGVRATQ